MIASSVMTSQLAETRSYHSMTSTSSKGDMHVDRQNIVKDTVFKFPRNAENVDKSPRGKQNEK